MPFTLSQDNLPEYGSGYDLKIPGAKLPGRSSALDAIAKRQAEQANKFRASMPQRQQDFYNTAYGDTQRNLARNIRDTTATYNRRGLLNSGSKQGAVTGQKYGAMADLDSSVKNYNNYLNDAANQLENAGIEDNYRIAGLNPGLGNSSLYGAESQMRNDVSSSQAQSAIWNSLISGLSSGAGYYLGSRGKR